MVVLNDNHFNNAEVEDMAAEQIPDNDADVEELVADLDLASLDDDVVTVK